MASHVFSTSVLSESNDNLHSKQLHRKQDYIKNKYTKGLHHVLILIATFSLSIVITFW